MSRILRWVLGAASALAIASLAVAQPAQPVYLQYDGFVRNADGTLTLSFGYFNMNNADVTVQSGDANMFTPAPADRNQPVTFRKGRHRFACSIVVDKTFDGKLQWTLTVAGKRQVTTAKALDPLYELELNSARRATAGLELPTAPKNVCVNRAPSVEVASPLGEPVTNFSARVDRELALNGHIEDDGLPRGSSVKVAWKKTAGPGDVTFASTSAGPTSVKFSAPGNYVLELSATDGDKTGSVTINVRVNDAPLP